MMVKNGLGRDQDTLDSIELVYYQKVDVVDLKYMLDNVNVKTVCLCFSIGLHTDSLLC